MIAQELGQYKYILLNIFYVPGQCCKLLSRCPGRSCQVVRTFQFKSMLDPSSLNMNPSRVIMELSSLGVPVLIPRVVSIVTGFVVVLGFTVTGDWGELLFGTVSFCIKSFSSHTYLITSVLAHFELFTPSGLHW